MRHIGPEGFAQKMREYNGKGHLQEWRERWEHIANRYLERFGHEAHIDHRTLEAQGVDREPTTHVGPTATDFERQGVSSERGGINRQINARNQQRDKLNAQSAQAQRELEETRKAYNAKCVEEIRAAWKASPDGLDFMMELNNRGFCLAEDGKGRYAAVDARGFAHRLDEKIYGYLVAPSMRDAIETVRRDCPALIIPTVEEYRQELRQQREKRRDSRLGATLYNRADMVSMQRDAMRHLKDARRIQEQRAKEQAEQQRRQKEERERQRQERESRTTSPALRDPLVIHAKQQGGKTPQQEPVRRQETLKELDEIAGHRETIRQRQELAQQQEAARQREELARQQEQKRKEGEQQRQKEERERREKQQQQERQREERERYQTKQTPRDQQTEKREHKRATTEQTDAKQRRTHDDAMREIWQRKARAAQERGRDDYERERERER